MSYKPDTKLTMDFPSAIREVTRGDRITRLEWKSTDTYGLVANGFLVIHNAGEPILALHQWIVNDGDLLAEDWVTIDSVVLD